ncbi:MAG: PQQ-like beta-propeller repeat protein [Verrucomicrobiales bacterium]|nr:PQQ-like beta-propeller repeat protein [Verrucomicrobiales bacterium]
MTLTFPAKTHPHPKSRLRNPAFLAGTLLLLAAGAHGADWPEWRGPKRNDHSPDSGLLKTWPAQGPKRLWLNEDVGLGYSGYSIVGDRLFTMGLRGEQEFLIALDAKTGKSLWETPAGAKYPNNWGDGPRATPTVDGAFVFAMGGQGSLVCAQVADGKKVWEKSMTGDLGGKLQNWGYTESVLVTGDLVICTPGGSQGTLAALKKSTGDVVWRTTDLTDAAQYSSPILAQHAGKPQIIQLVEKRFFGVDPANGKVLWKQDFPGRVAVIPTPIYHDGHVYVSAGYGTGCALIKLGADQSVTEVYANKVMKNHHGGVILVGDHLYGHSDPTAWVCQDFKTGAEVWADKSLGKGAIHYADGMLYCIDEKTGDVALVEASPAGWKEKGRFKLEPQTTKRAREGRIWTHPVVVNGRLYLRDQELLFCYDVKG